MVTIDRENCVRQAGARQAPAPEASDIVRSINSGETEYADYRPERDAEEKLVNRFRDPDDPLKVIIVTAKFLTGFDALILQTMYLDNPCGTTRLQAIDFDEEGIRKVVSNIAELLEKLPGAVQKCSSTSRALIRSVSGCKGLIAAQDCLPNKEVRDRFEIAPESIWKHPPDFILGE